MTILKRLPQQLAVCLVLGMAVGASAQVLDVLWSSDHGAQLGAVAFSPDGTLVASGSRYTFGGHAYVMLWDADSGKQVDRYDDFSVNQDSIIDLAISAPSQVLAAGYIYADFYHGYARTDLFDIAAHTRIARYNGTNVSFSADGSLVATGGGGFVRDVYVHEVATGQLIEDVYTGDYIWSLALAPDGTYFAAGSDDGQVNLWTVPGAAPLPALITGTGQPINTVAISPDSTLVAAGTDYVFGGPGTIMIWNARTGAHVRTLLGHERTYDVTFSPDGRKLISYGSNQLKVWRLREGALLGTYNVKANDVQYGLAGAKIVFFSGYDVTVAVAPTGVVGDINCDGDIDFGDINPFVLALSGHGAYWQQYGNCDWLNADLDDNGTVDFGDINPFVALLAGGGR